MDIFERLFVPIIKDSFVPTIEDIKNEEVKKVAKRLKEKTIKETLTNIVEWQERNLNYWTERGAETFFTLLCIIPLIVSVSIWLLLPAPNDVIKYIFIFFIIILFIFFIIILCVILDFIYVLIGFLIISFTILLFVGSPAADKLFNIFQYLSIPFGGIIFLLLYLTFLNYRRLKKQLVDSPKKQLVVDSLKQLVDTFKPSLPVDKILKYRLAVCRDYAKLTASLLLNIYPESKIYFITIPSPIPSHVATAIKHENKIYVLDHELPVCTLEKWLILWEERKNKKKIKPEIYDAIVEKKKLKIKKVDIKKETIKDLKIPRVNIKDLENKLTTSLGINQTPGKSEVYFEYPFKNLAISYEEDEIITFSIMKTIENKIRKEFCENLDKISRIELEQDKKNIILKIYG